MRKRKHKKGQTKSKKKTRKLNKKERARAEVRHELRQAKKRKHDKKRVTGVARTEKHTKVAVYFQWPQQFVKVKGRQPAWDKMTFGNLLIGLGQMIKHHQDRGRDGTVETLMLI